VNKDERRVYIFSHVFVFQKYFKKSLNFLKKFLYFKLKFLVFLDYSYDILILKINFKK